MTAHPSPDAPRPHTRCDRTVDCPCWRDGATAEARTRILPERSRQIVEYIRALVEGEPDLAEAAIAQRVADVFAARSASPDAPRPDPVARKLLDIYDAAENRPDIRGLALDAIQLRGADLLDDDSPMDVPRAARSASPDPDLAAALPQDDTIREWQSDLRFIDRTLDRVLTRPDDGHIPIWAREDRATIKRLVNQMDAIIANRALRSIPAVSTEPDRLREALAVADAAAAFDDAQRAYNARLAEPRTAEEPDLNDPAVAAEWFRPWREVEAANLKFRTALASYRAAIAAALSPTTEDPH